MALDIDVYTTQYAACQLRIASCKLEIDTDILIKLVYGFLHIASLGK